MSGHYEDELYPDIDNDCIDHDEAVEALKEIYAKLQYQLIWDSVARGSSFIGRLSAIAERGLQCAKQ